MAVVRQVPIMAIRLIQCIQLHLGRRHLPLHLRQSGLDHLKDTLSFGDTPLMQPCEYVYFGSTLPGECSFCLALHTIGLRAYNLSSYVPSALPFIKMAYGGHHAIFNVGNALVHLGHASRQRTVIPISNFS